MPETAVTTLLDTMREAIATINDEVPHLSDIVSTLETAGDDLAAGLRALAIERPHDRYPDIEALCCKITTLARVFASLEDTDGARYDLESLEDDLLAEDEDEEEDEEDEEDTDED